MFRDEGRPDWHSLWNLVHSALANTIPLEADSSVAEGPYRLHARDSLGATDEESSFALRAVEKVLAHRTWTFAPDGQARKGVSAAARVPVTWRDSGGAN